MIDTVCKKLAGCSFAGVRWAYCHFLLMHLNAAVDRKSNSNYSHEEVLDVGVGSCHFLSLLLTAEQV